MKARAAVMALYRLRDRWRWRLRSASSWLVLIGCGCSLALLAEGHIVLAVGLALVTLCLSWLAGLWVVPRTGDAYIARAERILSVAFRQSSAADREQAIRVSAINADLTAFLPTEALRIEHDALGRELMRAHQVNAIPDAMLVDETRHHDRLRRRLREVEAAARSTDQVYADALAHYRAQRREAAVDVQRDVERPLREAREGLSAMRVPPAWTECHRALFSSFDAYLNAVGEYYAAAQASDTKRLIDAATALVERKREVDAQRLRCRVGVREHVVERAEALS